METQLYTSAYLAALLAIPHREVESELEAAGYRPELVINLTCHWGPDAKTWLTANMRRLQLDSDDG